jgi:hypothetical protein
MRMTRWLAAMAVIGVGTCALGAGGTGRVITTGPADSGVQPPPDFSIKLAPPTVTMPPPGATIAMPPGPPMGPGTPGMAGPPGPRDPFESGVIWMRSEADAATAPAGPPKMMKMVFLGVGVGPTGEVLAEQLGLAAGTGLVVNEVEDGSPAAKAGIARHDILTRLGDQILINPPQLHVLVRMQKAGDKVTVTLIRGGKERKVAVEMVEAERPVGPEPGMRMEMRPMGPMQPLKPEAGGSELKKQEQRQDAEAKAPAATAAPSF